MTTSNARSLLPSFSCRLCRTWIISRGRSMSRWFLRHSHWRTLITPRRAACHIPSPFFRRPSNRNLNPLVSTCKCLVCRPCNPIHVRSPGMTSVQSIVLEPLCHVPPSSCHPRVPVNFLDSRRKALTFVPVGQTIPCGSHEGRRVEYILRFTSGKDPFASVKGIVTTCPGCS